MLKILVAAALCALATSASAFSVKFQSSTTGSFFTVATTATSAKLTAASLVRIGTFANAPASTATFADLSRDFQEFAVSTTGYKANPAAANDVSKFATATINPKAGVENASFLGKKLYIFVYDAATAATASNAAVFSSSLSAGGAVGQSTWFFAGDETPGASDLTYGINDINQAWNGSVGTATANALVLGAMVVPEPTSLVFGAFGLIGLLARRRR